MAHLITQNGELQRQAVKNTRLLNQLRAQRDQWKLNQAAEHRFKDEAARILRELQAARKDANDWRKKLEAQTLAVHNSLAALKATEKKLTADKADAEKRLRDAQNPHAVEEARKQVQHWQHVLESVTKSLATTRQKVKAHQGELARLKQHDHNKALHSQLNRDVKLASDLKAEDQKLRGLVSQATMVDSDGAHRDHEAKLKLGTLKQRSQWLRVQVWILRVLILSV